MDHLQRRCCPGTADYWKPEHHHLNLWTPYDRALVILTVVIAVFFFALIFASLAQMPAYTINQKFLFMVNIDYICTDD